MILVVDNYDSFTWNLVHYIEQAGGRTHVIRNDELTTAQALALAPSGLVLSPGPCTPNEAGICVDLVREAPEDLPILGVCLGHQSIGQALGGAVVSARDIHHGKLSVITQTGGVLFDGLPESFTVTRYHSLAVRAADLPDSLRIDATTPDGEIMAVSHTTRPVFGVQFHPESIRTEHGHAMLENFVRQTRRRAGGVAE